MTGHRPQWCPTRRGSDVLVNTADEVVTFPEFVVDSNGDFHAFWWDFSEGRGWMWSRSTDQGRTWEPQRSLTTALPQGGGTLVATAKSGVVVSVLLEAFGVSHLRWTSGSDWSEPETLRFEQGATEGSLAVGRAGLLTVAAATGEGVFMFSYTPGGPWRAEGVLSGTEGRTIDAVLAAGGDTGRSTILWHESGVVGFNVGSAGGLSLASSVPTLAEVNLDPIVVATSVAISAGLLFLIPFPADIFNNTLAEHHDEIVGWWRKRRRPRSRFWQSPLGLLAFLAVTALMAAFLDPGFGINAASAATLVGLMGGLTVTVFGFALPVLFMRRAKAGEWGNFRVLPPALAAAAGCVIISRAIQFLPGYLYGVVLGLTFSREVPERDQARETAAASVVVLGLALVAWGALGSVRSRAGFGSRALETTLAAVLVSGLEGLAIGLLPLRGMPGKTLFETNRRWWVGIWGVSVLLFFHVLVNPQSGYLIDTALVPVATTIGMLVLFGLISFGLWGYFAIRDRTKE
ncbi:MAG: FGLLP motif-containing membrane protein [Actinomycetota bacterium]